MDAYKLLGLRPSATLAEAEDAYRRLLRVYHPDLHQHEGPEALALAEQRTQALNAAIGEIRRLLPGRHAAAGSTRAGRDPEPAPNPGASSGDASGPGPRPYSWDPFSGSAWDTAPDQPRDEPPSVACPLCDEWFTTSGSLKAHVLNRHDMQFDKVRRHRRRRRRIDLPLTVLVPLNGIAAIFGAALSNLVLGATALTLWIFALMMAPSVIQLFTRES